jgi:hypothetical protein
MFGAWQRMNNPKHLENGWRINKMEHNENLNENLQVKAYRIAYDEAFQSAKNSYNFEQKEAWVAEAVKYAKLIEEVQVRG